MKRPVLLRKNSWLRSRRRIKNITIAEPETENSHKKPSIWRLLEALQADTAEASAKVLRHAVGTLSLKKKKAATATQERQLRLYTEYVDSGRDLKDFMGAIGHNICLSCD